MWYQNMGQCYLWANVWCVADLSVGVTQDMMTHLSVRDIQGPETCHMQQAVLSNAQRWSLPTFPILIYIPSQNKQPAPKLFYTSRVVHLSLFLVLIAHGNIQFRINIFHSTQTNWMKIYFTSHWTWINSQVVNVTMHFSSSRMELRPQYHTISGRQVD